MLQVIKENAIRVTMLAGTAAILTLVGVYFNFHTKAIASEEVVQHNGASTSHTLPFEIIAKSIRRNRTDLDIITERMKQTHMAMNASMVRQEVRATRIEGKIDRILEKL